MSLYTGRERQINILHRQNLTFIIAIYCFRRKNAIIKSMEWRLCLIVWFQAIILLFPCIIFPNLSVFCVISFYHLLLLRNIFRHLLITMALQGIHRCISKLSWSIFQLELRRYYFDNNRMPDDLYVDFGNIKVDMWAK